MKNERTIGWTDGRTNEVKCISEE